MDEFGILEELGKIKRVLWWIMLDRQIKSTNTAMSEKVRKDWEEGYSWIIDYLPRFDKGKK